MLWYMRFVLFKLLSVFGLVSKYVKTDEIKKDVIRETNKFLNFDEFRKDEPKYSSSPKTNIAGIKNTTDEIPEIRKTDCIIEKDKTMETVSNGLTLNTGDNREKQYSNQDDLNDIDMSLFKDPKIYGTGDKKLLLLDDVELVANLYKTTFNRINRMHDVNIEKDYMIISSIGKLSGYRAYKYILNNKVDYALLDITLGDLIRNNSNKAVEIDGVDIAIKLLELNPNIKFKFISSHTLNKRNYTMVYYFNKFERMTNLDISEHYIYKNGDFGKDIYSFLYGDS